MAEILTFRARRPVNPIDAPMSFDEFAALRRPKEAEVVAGPRPSDFRHFIPIMRVDNAAWACASLIAGGKSKAEGIEKAARWWRGHRDNCARLAKGSMTGKQFDRLWRAYHDAVAEEIRSIRAEVMTGAEWATCFVVSRPPEAPADPTPEPSQGRGGA